MYLTTTLASLPATSSNFSSLQTINLQRKPLPPLPNNLQQTDQFSSQKSTSMQFYSQNNVTTTTITTTSTPIIIHDSSSLEQALPERVSDFAAHMTCFLWFGDYIMDSSSIIPPPGGNGHRRFPDFKPRDAFKKFCRDVISATQVSRSVIHLSLLYIHRMKINNPAIKGQNGSEYRTFTVALMLANKFLDDNTYTNKTWSEVTNIPVSEINTMEMEFLGSLNYQLYVSEKQYFDWVQNLSTYFRIGDNNLHDDDNSSPDGTISISQQQQSSQQQQQYIPVQHQQILVPVQSMATGFKRSAEQAFVDGMMVSPPKRANVYPVYSVQPSQQQSQQVYAQTIAYPTPPSSASSSRRVSAYYNIPTTSSNSSNMVYSSHSSQQSYEVRQTYTNVAVRNTQPQYTVMDPVGVFYATRRVQSNLINARSASSGFPVNNISFTTTVV
ncbi:2492_t:CDS:1 [Dentiscutata heterogama]|uniref:2492_t:CDS:1 n=1 Tax=Dentiscutata heterogama TaxID=1316150 RepID=A0ACA9JV21_9GLOM|nr:2492_t:CDS:1 [Dentiscutata heterogama]